MSVNPSEPPSDKEVGEPTLDSSGLPEHASAEEMRESASRERREKLKMFLTNWQGVIGLVLVIMFFDTSSDSRSLVSDRIMAGGKVDAPVPQQVFWCTFEGAVAIVPLTCFAIQRLHQREPR